MPITKEVAASTAVTPHKATLRRYDGEKWIPVYLATSADITVLGKEVKVLGGSHGAYNEGDIVSANENVQIILQKLLQTRIPPVYTAPDVKLKIEAGDQDGTYQVGKEIVLTLTSKYVQNDGGAVVAHTITKVSSAGSEVVLNNNEATLSGVISFTLGDEEVSFYSTVAYEQGSILQDNFEQDYPDGRIPAGAISSDSLSFYGGRYIYVGADSLGITTPVITFADIVTASIGCLMIDTSGSGDNKIPNIRLKVPEGSTRVTIAVPWSSDTNVTNPEYVRYVEAGNANVLDQFDHIDTVIEDDSGNRNFSLYTLSWTQPTLGEMTFLIEFNSGSTDFVYPNKNPYAPVTP